MLSGEAELREDKKAPIGGHVLRPVQAFAVHPESTRVLRLQDVRGPPTAGDLAARGGRLGRVRPLALDVDEESVAGGRLHRIGEPRSEVAKGHGPPGNAHGFLRLLLEISTSGDARFVHARAN